MKEQNLKKNMPIGNEMKKSIDSIPLYCSICGKSLPSGDMCSLELIVELLPQKPPIEN